MKNRIGIICAVIVSGLVLASFSPSLDGRAVVADEGAFPQGMFAKTVGYLPGDSITVSNLSTQKTIDILVVGALDPSEGVAILLSPEAAFALGIEKNSNIIVKITKRSGQLDEAVSGTAVIANGTADSTDGADTSVEPETAEKAAVPAGTDEPAAVAPAADTAPQEPSAVQPEDKNDVQEESGTVADASAPETIAATDTTAESETSEPDTEEYASDAETSAASVPESDESEKVAGGISASDEPAAVPSVGEDTAAGKQDRAEPAADEKVADRIPDSEETEKASAPESVPADKNAGDVPESVESEKVDDRIPAAENTVQPERADNTPAPEEEPAAEPFTEKPAENSAAMPVTEDTVSGTESEKVNERPAEAKEPDTGGERINAAVPPENMTPAEEDKVSSSDAYAPIILVPAEPNPPESAAEPVPESTSSVPAQKPDAAAKPESSGSSGEFDRYIVPNLKALESGRYYIQIGVYADENNIREVVKKYSAAYPITIVPLVSGRAKQLMIGPLSGDEYAVVIARFKSYGFKDAFLRKIK
jgi:hypothetical protein